MMIMQREASGKEARAISNSISPSSSEREIDLANQTRVKRVFNTIQFFATSIVFMSSWEAIAGNLSTVFLNGGPNTLVFGFLIVWCGAVSQAASMAEMASLQPIAGAMYHWTYRLAPARARRLATWIQGYLTWAGWISMAVGVCNSTEYWITSLVQLNYPNYVPQLWHGTLMVWAMLLIGTSINIWRFGQLVPWIESFAGFMHIAMFVAFSITLLCLAPKNDSNFVFLGRVDSSVTSGWGNTFVSWNLGLQTSVWAFIGFDAAAHLSEEVSYARQTVPRVMVYTNLLNGLMAWLFILVILFTVGNIDEVLKYPQPMLAVLYNATGSVPIATAMGSLFVFISICSSVVNVASLSRLTWSWARDGGLPGYLAFVDAKARVPTRAVLTSVSAVALLCLVNIGSSVALSVFISLSTVALYLSYFISILMMTLSRFSKDKSEPGPWNMGQLGLPVNIFALVYTAYITVWLPFPTILPVTGANFNYSGPILGAVILVSLGLWFLRRNSWGGLREDIMAIATKEDSDEG